LVNCSKKNLATLLRVFELHISGQLGNMFLPVDGFFAAILEGKILTWTPPSRCPFKKEKNFNFISINKPPPRSIQMFKKRKLEEEKSFFADKARAVRHRTCCRSELLKTTRFEERPVFVT
jgi:hypothetical protein